MLPKRTLGLALVSCMFCFAQEVASVPSGDRCKPPSGLKEAIAKDYPERKIVNLEDLSTSSRKLFVKEHGARCPGLVKINFYGGKRPAWALVLIQGDAPNRKTELVVARQANKKWEMSTLDTADAAPVPVVWRDKPGRYEDIHGERSLQAPNPVIVFCGYESWAIVYAWTGKAVEKVWISD